MIDKGFQHDWDTHHHIWVAHALQSVVHPSVRHLHQNILDGLAVLIGVDTFSGSEHFSPLKPVRVDVDPDYPLCPGGLATHDGCQSDSSEPKHGTQGIFFNLEETSLESLNPKAVN